ncbi:hypothetical protein [Tuwongella immobilis]|uniref:Uncharacterized protein n=1 Tax=Tuwongella immobilis TaxID=692036 RepID=A0A6C2YRX7_9BACT|nr:hypothetical protein [Tuwongella immobilis]VIP04418.1 unnamed protein product [Tuwongella immobilis]VTS06198.1 unnamed protein product [Tuwongella immobilis]
MHGSIAYDVRVLVVADYVFGTIDSIAARERLAQKAWAAVRNAASVECYLATYTFPRWSITDGMMAFAPLHQAIGVTGDTCVCYQVNRSPIADWISGDPASFCREEIHAPKLLAFLSWLLEDAELSRLAVWIGECDCLPSIQQVDRAEAVAVIRQKLSAGLRADLAMLVTESRSGGAG